MPRFFQRRLVGALLHRTCTLTPSV